MKNFSARFSIWVTLILVTITGCNKRGDSDPKQAFQTASPEIQARWQQAAEAAQTNNYATAVLTLRKLQLEPTLTPNQQAAVANQMAAVNQKLSAAEQKGDPEAKKAMEEIRQRWRFP